MSDALGRRTQARRAETLGDRSRRAELAADVRMLLNLVALMPYAVRVARIPVRATGALQIPRQRRPSLDELTRPRRNVP